ncbi:PqqD family peptide modification chaperone [Reyranella sp.]|uniref:PqqD family peptide modification chaperone n=1 Tax=Reyranella sp. TaxID=1929291 RepID=UPI003784ABC6
MGFCLVYDPAAREIYTLNPAAWLVFELCRGRTRGDAEAEYLSTFDEREQRARAVTEFADSLERLFRLGLVVEQPAGKEQERGETR